MQKLSVGKITKRGIIAS